MTEIANLFRGVVTDRKLTPKGLGDAKANMSLDLSSQWSKPAGIAGAVIDQIAYDLPEDYYAAYPQAVAAVTRDAANAVGVQILVASR